jgi:hypothetical protein
MIKWAKKLFQPEPQPEPQHATMVEVLQELWDIDEGKPPHEMPPPNVSSDIYAVESRDKTIPHRDPKRRQRYKRAK